MFWHRILSQKFLFIFPSQLTLVNFSKLVEKAILIRNFSTKYVSETLSTRYVKGNKDFI